MTRLALARPALALLAATLLAACGGDSDPAASPTPSPTTPVAVTTSPATSPSPSGGPGCPIRTSPDPATTVITATVTGKTVTTEKHTYSVKLGTRVRLAVTANTVDEVHVHSYDLHEATVPGCPTGIEFVANVPGTVEVELEKAKVHVFEIKAAP